MQAYIHQLDHGVLAVRTSPDDVWMKTTDLYAATEMCRTIDRFLDALSDLKACLEKYDDTHGYILLVTPADGEDREDDERFFEPERVLNRAS